jgi:hypothetical protein
MVDDNIGIQEVPFDMSKETLKSIRTWIDKITQLSIGIISGQKLDPNEMIVLKQKMVRQLIVLSSPLLGEDLEEVEEFFCDIKIKIGNVRNSNGWNRGVSVYTKDIDYKLDECIQGIEKSLNKYFIPTFAKGEKY